MRKRIVLLIWTAMCGLGLHRWRYKSTMRPDDGDGFVFYMSERCERCGESRLYA